MYTSAKRIIQLIGCIRILSFPESHSDAVSDRILLLDCNEFYYERNSLQMKFVICVARDGIC